MQTAGSRKSIHHCIVGGRAPRKKLSRHDRQVSTRLTSFPNFFTLAQIHESTLADPNPCHNRTRWTDKGLLLQSIIVSSVKFGHFIQPTLTRTWECWHPLSQPGQALFMIKIPARTALDFAVPSVASFYLGSFSFTMNNASLEIHDWLHQCPMLGHQRQQTKLKPMSGLSTATYVVDQTVVH